MDATDADPRTPVIAYAPAWLPSYEAAEHRVVERSRAALEQRVRAAGGRLLALDAPIESAADAAAAARSFADAGVDLVILQSASFAMGDVVLPFADAGLRLCLWAPSEPRRHGPIPLNGFVAMHLHAGVLATAGRATGARFTWLFGDPGRPLFEGRLAVVLASLRVLARLRSATVLRVGDVAPTFLNVASDRDAVLRATGAHVRTVPLGPLLDDVDARLADADRTEIDAAIAAMTADVAVDALSEDDLTRSAAVYLALRTAAERHAADAIAVRDWPEMQTRLGLHPGMAMSWLDHDDGVPAAAEGDVGGALSMLAARAAADAPAMLLDVNDLDDERDALLTWHCGGSPLAIADASGPRWTPHTTLAHEEGTPMGAVADLRFAPGPVTLLRVGRDGRRWFVVEGEVVESPHPGFDGSRGWISNFRDRDGRLRARDVAETLIAGGVEHHLALVPGHHAAALRTAAGWLGAQLVARIEHRDDPRLQEVHP
jgi:hypothetical protein